MGRPPIVRKPHAALTGVWIHVHPAEEDTVARVRFSSMLEAGSGVYGDSVVARGRSGYQVRARPKPKYRPTPNQAGSMARMAQAASAWNGLSRTQAEAWNAFAEGIVKAGYAAGEHYSPTGFNVFCALGSKLLQLNPSAVLPVAPPAHRFAGDYLRLSASVPGGSAPGVARVAADRPSGVGAVVEILVQKLKNERAAVGTRYYSNSFVTFTPGSMSHDLPLGTGTWALAYREVETATGQQTRLTPVGVVQVA